MPSIFDFEGADKVKKPATMRKARVAWKPEAKGGAWDTIPPSGPIVYALRNTRNNKVYIGSTRQFRRRAAVHISQLNSGSHPNAVLQQEWQEYGPQAFTWELVTHGYHREEQEAISELFSTTPELLYNQDFKPPKEQPGLQDESSNGGDVVIENPLLRRGFTQIPNAILRARQISANAKLVYVMLLSYAWHEGSCFPGQGRMANDLGLSRATVNQAIQELQSVGLITIERRGKMMTNRYILRDQDLSDE